jgi:hypothetical protein
LQTPSKIELSEIIARPGVFYAALPTLFQPMTGATIARVIIHELIAAVSVHKGPRVPIYVFIDEADRMMTADSGAVFSKSFRVVVLIPSRC